MCKKVYYDHNNSFNKRNPAQAGDLLLNAEYLKTLGVSLLDEWTYQDIYKSHLVIVHSDNYEQEQQYSNFPDNCIDEQIIVLISSMPRSEQSKLIANGKNKFRILFYTKSLEVLKKRSILTKLSQLDFANAKKILENKSTISIGWDEDPFFLFPDILVALYILCQCYLCIYFFQSNELLARTHPQIIKLVELFRVNYTTNGLTTNPSIDTVQSFDWWKISISDEHMKWEMIREKGEKQWQSLVREEDNKAAWDDLIARIDRSEKVLQKEVENFYLQMHALLSGR